MVRWSNNIKWYLVQHWLNKWIHSNGVSVNVLLITLLSINGNTMLPYNGGHYIPLIDARIIDRRASGKLIYLLLYSINAK